MKASSKRDKGRSQAKSDFKKPGKNYFSEIKEEIKKIAWPQVDELKMCTKVVISSTFVFGIGIYFADLIVKGALDSISMLSRVIFG